MINLSPFILKVLGYMITPQCAYEGLGEFMQPPDNPGQVSYRILRWEMDMAGIPYFGVIDGLLFDAIRT